MRRLALGDSGRFCIVVDNMLTDPQQLIAFACAQRTRFSPEDANYYPGPELPLDERAERLFDGFFSQHIRADLGARRTRATTCRMSIVTRKPEQLVPFQRIPHVDGGGAQAPGQGYFAMVLYLFQDERMGGTSFFRPRVGPAELSEMMARARNMDRDAFSALIDTPPSYPTSSNAWFEKIATIPAKFNRAVFYDGTIHHSGDTCRPDLLSPDPQTGRLTVNAFFEVRLNAA